MGLKRRQQMVRAAHVDCECRLGTIPRAPDVRRAGTVINDRGAHMLNCVGDGLAIEQIDRHPARPRPGIWRPAAGTMPGHEVAILGSESVEKVTAGKSG